MKIGVAQIRLSDSIAKNRDHILKYAGNAMSEGVEILNFPETALSGYIFDAFPTVNFDEVSGALSEIQEALSGSSLHLIIGTPYREARNVFNSAVVLFPDGMRQVYHKTHLVPYEQRYFKEGGKPLVFEVNGHRFGVIVCRDQNFPLLAEALARDGARGLFILSAHYYNLDESRLKLEKNRALPIARAYENGIFVFKSNAVGTSKRMISLGKSLIVDSRGIVVQEAGETEETLLVYDIDFDKKNPSWS